jgi:hypothetical protein
MKDPKPTHDRDKMVRLLKGEKFNTYSGHKGMEPRLAARQIHQLSPALWNQCMPGDIVFCLVEGDYYTSLVISKSDINGLLIADNHGVKIGWTKSVFGKVTQIFNP